MNASDKTSTPAVATPAKAAKKIGKTQISRSAVIETVVKAGGPITTAAIIAKAGKLKKVTDAAIPNTTLSASLYRAVKETDPQIKLVGRGTFAPVGYTGPAEVQA